MKFAPALFAIAAFAASSQAAWLLGVKQTTSGGNSSNFINTQSISKYKVVRVFNQVVGTTEPGALVYTAFLVAPWGSSYAGEGIIFHAPNRADSKRVIEQLTKAFENGWAIQVSNWDTPAKFETISNWMGITQAYRVNAGDMLIVETQRD